MFVEIAVRVTDPHSRRTVSYETSFSDDDILSDQIGTGEDSAGHEAEQLLHAHLNQAHVDLEKIVRTAANDAVA